ncbi:MAG TPA: helix-turn-helix domain-containing protein [Caulobacteraceae bacterium]|nr:helix-turn-helix domain-containing protein [Caulobacteraceae bacterium]
MTPLDSGSSTEVYSPAWDQFQPVSLSDAETLADGFRAAREATGRSLQDFAEITRVRREYLSAIEEGAWGRLPSRPFSTGYVRSYARALGLDEEVAAERFKREADAREAPLEAPVGVEFDEVKSRRPLIVGISAVAISAVVLWNVAQRAMNAEKVQPHDLARAASVDKAWSLGYVPGQVVKVATPEPAPLDQTVPVPYVPPGLAAEFQAVSAELVQTGAEPVAPVRKAFNPKGAVYGADPRQALVILQATKPAHIIVRSDSGDTVYFARQLAAGEAYRAPPALSGVQIDVSDPVAFDLFLNGEYAGKLETVLNPLGKLNQRAQQAAAALAAQIQAQQAAQAEAAARAAAAAQPAPATAQPAPAQAAPGSRPAAD